jgi:hypothetical protein
LPSALADGKGSETALGFSHILNADHVAKAINLGWFLVRQLYQVFLAIESFLCAYKINPFQSLELKLFSPKVRSCAYM